MHCLCTNFYYVYASVSSHHFELYLSTFSLTKAVPSTYSSISVFTSSFLHGFSCIAFYYVFASVSSHHFELYLSTFSLFKAVPSTYSSISVFTSTFLHGFTCIAFYYVFASVYSLHFRVCVSTFSAPFFRRPEFFSAAFAASRSTPLMVFKAHDVFIKNHEKTKKCKFDSNRRNRCWRKCVYLLSCC